MDPELIARLIAEDSDISSEIAARGGSERLALISSYLVENDEFGVDYEFDYLIVWDRNDLYNRAFIYPKGSGSLVWVEGGDEAIYIDMADPTFFSELGREIRNAIERSSSWRPGRQLGSGPWGA